MTESPKYAVSDPTDSSTLRIRLVPLDFVIEWERCGLLADYLAAHVAHAFENRDGVRTALSTVMNELVENVVKFSSDKASPATITVVLRDNEVVIETESRGQPHHVEALVATLRALAERPAEDLFLERVSTVGAGSESGLGLLVLQKDYGVRFDSRVERTQDGGMDVWLTATLRADVLEEG